MEPKIVTRDEFTVVGVQYFGKDMSQLSKLWCSFIPQMGSVPNSVSPGVCYGISDSMNESGEFRYIAGVEVSCACCVPEGMVSVTLPGGKYAVFTHKGPAATMSETFGKIFGEWLPASGYTPCGCAAFELYDNRFNDTETSEADIYIAIK